MVNRFFNTSGPIKRDIHYYIDPLDRMKLNEIQMLLDQSKYFMLHAPRQSGKTTYLYALTDYLNQQGAYKCLYINIEAAESAGEKVKKAMRTIIETMANQAYHTLNDPFLKDNWEKIFESSSEFSVIHEILSLWCKQNKKPIVVCIDGTDSLIGDTLISVLRQLRSGFINRPDSFPQSVILCGVRDVRDYRMYSNKDKAIITGGSPYNINAATLKLEDFIPHQIEKLYQQHTKETGQKFNKEVFSLVWELTEGQPWLVNALADEACFKMDEGRDRRNEITTDMIQQAKENLILRCEKHLAQLADLLKEERVQRVIDPLISETQVFRHNIKVDDIDYAIEFGLLKKERGGLRISNRIYKEMIFRELKGA
ncbi:MAG: AAA-like domain-containing protein [Candidatus Omnitrophota bacterium]